MSQKVSTHSLIGVVSSTDLETATQLMVKENIGALGVYDASGEDLLGILSERDVVRAVAGGKRPATTPVDEVMTRHPITVAAPISVDRARDLMDSGHVRHLIVRENGGDRIVSLRDV